jgi:hypothetical protein
LSEISGVIIFLKIPERLIPMKFRAKEHLRVELRFGVVDCTLGILKDRLKAIIIKMNRAIKLKGITHLVPRKDSRGKNHMMKKEKLMGI